ncbi:MAG: sialate O-acetylesterase [Pirellulaceae bacterium]
MTLTLVSMPARMFIVAVGIIFSLPISIWAEEQVDLPSPEKFHLYVLAGQSNMAGRGRVEEEDRTPHPRVLALNKEGKWMPAVDPLHFDKPKVVGVGLGKTFGQIMAEADPDVTIGLIPCAVGGSSIDAWAPGGFHSQPPTHPWDDCVKRLEQVADDGVWKGVLWHQGESDGSAAKSAAYEEKLHAVIARFREVLKQPNLPVVVGELGHFKDKPESDGRKMVNLALKTLPTKMPHTAFVPSHGLTDKGDRVHFDAASYRELGKRYAAAYQKLISE